MASVNVMVTRVHALLGTDDVNDWESRFIRTIWDRSQHGANTSTLSTAQVEKLEELHDKHFSG